MGNCLPSNYNNNNKYKPISPTYTSEVYEPPPLYQYGRFKPIYYTPIK